MIAQADRPNSNYVSSNYHWRPDLFMNFQQPVYVQYFEMPQVESQRRSPWIDLAIALAPVALPLLASTFFDRRN
jgi:hypothetical protein